MKTQQKSYTLESLRMQTSFQNYNIFQLFLITLRILPAAAIMCFVIIFQEYIRPRIMIPTIRRYFSCIVNLICIRAILLLMGFLRFECENYRYFDKTSRMMTYRSGWVGVASHTNIIQFLYYSYLFNPVYARMIEYHDGTASPNSVKLYYTPMSFKEAFFAAFNFRGFDPIVLKGEQQLKRFKRRKMMMPTLISECFQQINGPIMILLPSFKHKQQISVHKILGEDIYDNQKKFLRSGIVFTSQIEQYKSRKDQERSVAQFCQNTYSNQLIFITQICSQIKLNFLLTTAMQTIKHKYEYNRQMCSNFIDELYEKSKCKVVSMGFERYLEIMDAIDEEIKNSELDMVSEPRQKQEIKDRMRQYTEQEKVQNNFVTVGIDKKEEFAEGQQAQRRYAELIEQEDDMKVYQDKMDYLDSRREEQIEDIMSINQILHGKYDDEMTDKFD